MSPGALKLESILPLWRNLQPPEKRTWFDAFVRKYRHAIVEIIDEYLARKAAKKSARPRADAAATKALGRKLRALIMTSARVGRYYYHSPDVEIGEDEIIVTYGGEKPDAGTLQLHVRARGTKTPQGNEEIDIRGAVLGGEEGTEVIHQFDRQVGTVGDLLNIKETVFARWFGVPVPPERKLTPVMQQALTALRAEETAEPDKLHSWAGVHDSTKDALIARGLAQVLENKHGGFPHYRTTPAGQAYLAPERAANESPSPPADELPPDLWTAAQRTKANLAAMQLVADRGPGKPLSLAEYRTVAAYSGWGGLSIDKVQTQFPADLEPETFGLIHEYYTPSVIAEAVAKHVCPLLTGLVGRDGIVRAVEPSVGIGRLVRALAAPRCVLPQGDVTAIQWTTIEFSKVSSAMFTALRPDAQHFQMPFERWIRLHGPAASGTIHLILSNPPYGERGEYAREDGDEFYDEKAAYLYFMRRALDLLVPGGLGVFLVPAGLLSGASNRGARARLLLRHHLSAAYRLPSHTTAGREFVPGANVVMDILFWRSRGGELAEVDAGDAFILEGDYFDRFPNHVLGKTEGEFAGGEEETGRRFRYKVVGDFTGLPELGERPFCSACQVGPIASRPVPVFQTVARPEEELPSDVPEELGEALLLGRRVGRYLAALASDEDRAVQLWPELHAALQSFAEREGNPWRKQPLRELADKRELFSAQQILNAFDKKGALVPALASPPQVTPRYGGRPDDVVAQAEALFRQQRSLTLAQLVAFHQKLGGALSEQEILAALTAAEWNINGERWDHLYPRDAYLTGKDLWDRYDRAVSRAERGDEQARVQARRLLDAIRPAVFEDIPEINPQLGYVPLDLVSGWISDTINARYGRIVLERRDGFVQVRGSDYVDSDELGGLSPETLAFLGYYNHDPALFQIPPEKPSRDAPPLTREERAEIKKSLAERRIAQANKWSESFKAWVAADPTRRAQLTDAYNRSARGRIVPTVPTEPLDIARWGVQAPRLKPHQVAGARRVLATRGGLVAFDVGVGKTYTALAILARARQEGWVRRPVILVPGSLVWKWHDDVLCTLPDYRVAVIGSKRKRITRGERKGIVTSETDTPKERAAKWIAFQSGQVDVVILSFDALARTRMNESAVLEYIQQVESVRRSIALRRRNLEEKAQTQKGRDKLSERERALLEHGTRAWVQEILALPEGHEYDPGIAWDELGADMLIVDEAAAFKNLHKPQAREDGVPKFMGSGGEGSDRAWQLDFRAAQVRKNTGGAGIVLLTATPAKNSPLEFYNLIQYIDPNAFLSAGIHDPEQFIDRFLKIEYREVLDSTFEVAKRPAVTGFKNLDDLRTIIFTYGEFRTAAEVDLKLPRPIVQTLTIKMDDVQEAKYARYVRQIEDILENPSPDGPSNIILGLLARLSLIALHAALEDGYTYSTALAGGLVKRKVTLEDGTEIEKTVQLPRPVYESPKLTECARRVSASQHCGHIIFCEPTVVHLWMREVLVAHGVPRDRIAILNAEETAPADRIRIAREFNGLSSEPPAPGTCARPTDSKTAPKYDVVIANSVAYEGVDLQVRTCTIHHIDLPWTPADLEQRNGRAVRQGNTLDTVQIYYYFADGSSDGYRFSLIDGKAGWLGDLLKSQVRDTNNPAAQQQLSPEDILLMISRNKEKTKRLLEEKRQRQLAEARAKIAREAVRLLRQANGRFAEARRTDDAERAAKLREEGDLRLADIERLDPEAWPWARWMYAVRDTELLVPETGGAPVFEGLRIARPRAGYEGQYDFLEFGQVVTEDTGQKIGLRAPGSPSWELVIYTDGKVSGADIRPEHMPREDGPAWPDDDDTRTAAALDKRIGSALRYGKFAGMGWRGAPDGWAQRWWARFEPAITDALSRSSSREVVPIVRDGRLVLAVGEDIREGTVLPPTRAGWQQYIELAPASGEKFTPLKDVGKSWWGRTIPGDLLSQGRPKKEGEADAVSPAADVPPPDTNAAEREPAKVAAPPAAENVQPPARLPYDEARAAIKATGLPPKKYAYYLRQAETAIADGKSYLPIVSRARKAAQKDKPSEASSRAAIPRAVPRPRRSVVDAALESFNAEPGWRLGLVRGRPNGYVLAVYPEGQTQDEAVASVDVIDANIDEIRWLGERLSPVDQDAILGRIERALWAALDADEERDEDVQIPSPIQDLIDMMERRSKALGARPTISQNPARTDGYRQIAEALRDLAQPTGMTAEELQRWLESEDMMAAGEVVGQAASAEPAPVRTLMRDLWDSILDVHPLEEVTGKPGDLRVTGEAIFGSRGDEFVLERVREGDRAALRRIRVRRGEYDEDAGTYAIEEPTDRLVPGAEVHRSDRNERFFAELYQKIGALEDDLVRAPKTLQDVRTLLYWTAVMLDAPLCQGEVKQRATRAFEQAKVYHDTARTRLLEGCSADAVRRLQAALRRISAAAAEIARSCGEGQITLVATPAELEVRREDQAVIESGSEDGRDG